MCFDLEYTMNNDVKSPPWLTFVSQASEHDPSLRLTMLNPINGEMTVFINQVIDMDEQKKQINSSMQRRQTSPDP
jgi:hypothetical protein